MSTKRPLLDLKSLTAEQAAPMPEAAQRVVPAPTPARALTTAAPRVIATENVEALAFKVSPAFRRRFRGRAVAANLKLNQLLFEALEAWEEKQGLGLPR